jgi:predicted nuclease of predicted toxin-antitoxin system
LAVNLDIRTKFLIDECLSPGLALIARSEFGFQADHVPWLGNPPKGQKSWKDWDIVERLRRDPRVLVTNNRKDFVSRHFEAAGLDPHDGLIIILQKSDFEREAELFRLVMHHITVLTDTVNKLVEIDADGTIRIEDWPNPLRQRPWADPF